VGRGKKRGAGYRGKRERGESRWNCDSSDSDSSFYFLRTNRSIFDNRENGLLYFAYVIAVISV